MCVIWYEVIMFLQKVQRNKRTEKNRDIKSSVARLVTLMKTIDQRVKTLGCENSSTGLYI